MQYRPLIIAMSLALPSGALAEIGAADMAAVTDAQHAAADGATEIIVTGEKADRTLQDTPASVAVATSQAITDQNLYNVYDLLERTPNLSVNGSRTSFSIRGIDAFNVSGSGDGALASVYVDGAVLPQAAFLTGPLDLYDIAQVEVFRGPQSTVQGRNALAGAVIVRTTDPSYEWTGRARALLTDKDGQRRFGAAIGGPIVDGQIAFRLAGEFSRSDGLVYDATLGRDGDHRVSETIRGKLLITPSAIPALRIVGTYVHDRHRRGIYNSELDAPFDPRDRITTQDQLDRVTVNSDIATLEMGYDLGAGLSLNSVTNYSDIRSFNIYDQDRRPTPGNVGRIADPSKTFQQELRLNIKKSWVQGLIGAYYLRDDNRDYFFESRQQLGLRRLGIDQSLAGLGLSQATVNAVVDGIYGGTVPISNNLVNPRLTKNYAGFADLTFPITERLRILAGLRYDHESQNRGSTQSIVILALPNPATLANPALAPIVTQLNALLTATANNATGVQSLRTVRYSAWLPKAGVTFDIAREASLTLSAQRGYRAGGSGLNQQRGEYYSYDPEYTWNYELALRSQFLDRRLTVNANVYYIDWKDQQVSVQLTPGSVFDTQVINAGKSRLYGAELELSGRPTRRLNLFLGAGYSNTKFEDSPSSAGQLFQFVPGNQFANAPHWTLSGGATWRHPTGLFANVNANYRSGYFQDVVDQPAIAPSLDIRGRTLVNAKIGWQGKHIGAFLVATNIFDVNKPTQSFLDLDGRNRGVLTEPRVLGLSFEGRF